MICPNCKNITGAPDSTPMGRQMLVVECTKCNTKLIYDQMDYVVYDRYFAYTNEGKIIPCWKNLKAFFIKLIDKYRERV